MSGEGHLVEEGGDQLGAQEVHQILSQDHVTLHPQAKIRFRGRRGTSPYGLLHHRTQNPARVTSPCDPGNDIEVGNRGSELGKGMG